MSTSWILVSLAAASMILAAALAQRELYNRGRQIELREQTINRLHNEVEMRDRRLEAEEILLRRASEYMRINLNNKDK